MDYETFAAAYAEHRRADPAVVRALVDGARITASARVLEVGAGTGNYAVAVHEATGAACVGVEPSDAMREVAAGRSGEVRFLAGHAEKLPFSDGVFDAVFSVDVAHHIGDLDRAFAEAARVLRAGGRLCVATDDEESIRARVHAAYFPETVAVELARYPTIGRLDELLRTAGLEPHRVERTASAYELADVMPFRELAFSSLALIGEDAHRAGLERLEADLARGPVAAVDSHVLVWAAKP
ncbi:MAG: class I SAM-dependent methyltransferase [Gaiellaceae bacterium]